MASGYTNEDQQNELEARRAAKQRKESPAEAPPPPGTPGRRFFLGRTEDRDELTGRATTPENDVRPGRERFGSGSYPQREGEGGESMWHEKILNPEGAESKSRGRPRGEEVRGPRADAHGEPGGDGQSPPA